VISIATHAQQWHSRQALVPSRRSTSIQQAEIEDVFIKGNRRRIQRPNCEWIFFSNEIEDATVHIIMSIEQHRILVEDLYFELEDPLRQGCTCTQVKIAFLTGQ